MLTSLRLARRSAVRVSRCARSVPAWATLDPDAHEPARLANLCGGEWRAAAASRALVDPLARDRTLAHVPDTAEDELAPFAASLAACPKSGVHNRWKAPERMVMWGEVTARMAAALAEPATERFFARAIQRCVPKSEAQARGEVRVTRDFLHNFSGDQVRFLSKGFSVSGDRVGQASNGLRWPFGPVAIIAPFNFPLEIPALQLLGALYMGNKPVLKPSENVSMVMEQFARLMHACGAPPDAFDLIHCRGAVAQALLDQAPVRLTQFTGSSRVGELLARRYAGKVRLEDAGFDWKLLGPDVPPDAATRAHVAWQSDQDAYECQGQKCSAQSLLVAHENWLAPAVGLLDALKERAARRSLADLTAGPTLTVTTAELREHTERLAALPGARVLFGGHELTERHDIPEQYGAFAPTAVYVPLDVMLSDEHFAACTTEVFGPFQVVTSYTDADLPRVLDLFERCSHHLTAAVVSNDPQFVNHVLAHTVNGTTYAGWLARTTGAPQNHFFGPAGDPRGAAIGSPEGIISTWSCHREVIMDTGPAPEEASA